MPQLNINKYLNSCMYIIRSSDTYCNWTQKSIYIAFARKVLAFKYTKTKQMLTK